ncbi:TetR/AcrR family transcriptional regulator [Kitasatospora kifunensis]|uniref:AcrR family transcriptional regulator n=1 Tax=Kitasatospora kifunensis TaxID=58351 RepID=A0A7W7VSQ9_KITKI|nr:TetR/AcrR family transcriptional regulator [Kitasatospora kifunensis]MBB4921417.1 AcrR family transcriptional regulator [Kitasatospora kifunensis]
MSTPSPTATRRRGEALEQAIFQAVRDELLDVGYARLTMEGVATRAQTSKPVLYRRWPNRAALVLEAMSRRHPKDSTPPDTGSVREDLLALLRQIAGRFDGVYGEVLRGLLGETIRDPELSTLARQQLDELAPQSGLTTVLDRAVERGEVDPHRLTPRTLRLPLDLLRNEVLVNGTPLCDRVIDEIVDEIVLPLVRYPHPHGADQVPYSRNTS